MKPIPDRLHGLVINLPETGMGYTVATVTLRDGRVYPQVVIGSGYVSRVRGHDEVPFDPDDIADIKATHEKWDWPKPNRY